MDIKEYSYILAIVDYGSISRAAQKLYISQPSLTAYINNLERRLGFHFFVEGKGKSRLTPEGALYVSYARQIMTLNHNLYSQLDSFRSLKRGLVRMAITRTRGTVILPKLLPAMKEQYPDIRLEILEGNSRELEEALEKGELDFAILNDSNHSSRLTYRSLGDEEFVLLVPKKFQMTSQGIEIPESPYLWMDIRKMEKHQFVLLRQGQRMRELADMLFTQNNIKPPVIFETESAVTAVKLAEAGYGSAFVMDSYLETMPETIDVFSVGKPRIKKHLVAVCLKSIRLSKAAEKVIDVIASVI